MRRHAIVVVTIFCGLIVIAVVIRHWLYSPALTKTQRDILSRAEAGLHLFATKSATAASFYHEVRHESWWATSPMVLPTSPDTAYSVTVMRSTPVNCIAFYLHPTRTVCFIEDACAPLGYLALGLTYGHELQHRRDFRRGLVRSSDGPNSLSVRQSEARCQLVELVILDEYTEGRWAMAVDRHLKRFHQQRASVRRQHPLGERLFYEDAAWITREFGRAGSVDVNTLRAYFLFAAQYRQATKNQALSATDSLRVALQICENR